MTLTNPQKKFLRARSHKLNPIVWVGQQGLTDNVLAEIDQALSHHELLKVKIRVGDRLKRNQIVAQIVDQLAAETVQQTGNVAIFWRQNPEQPSIPLP